MSISIENQSVISLPLKPRDAVALALRRKLVVQAAKEVRKLISVQRVPRLSSSDFREFAAKGLPLIIEGVVEKWPISAFKESDLVKTFGSLRVSPRFGDYVPQICAPDKMSKDMSLFEYLKLVQDVDWETPPYVGDHSLPIPSLCEWPDYFERWDIPRVWLGPAGTVTRLHCDYEDNLFAQIWGRKRFLLYSPATADLLYLKEFHPLLFVSSFDPEHPDYRRFPLARSATALECNVGPGDLLYLPAGWFHHVRALEFSLSVNRWSPDEPKTIAVRW